MSDTDSDSRTGINSYASESEQSQSQTPHKRNMPAEKMKDKRPPPDVHGFLNNISPFNNSYKTTATSKSNSIFNYNHSSDIELLSSNAVNEEENNVSKASSAQSTRFGYDVSAEKQMIDLSSEADTNLHRKPHPVTSEAVSNPLQDHVHNAEEAVTNLNSKRFENSMQAHTQDNDQTASTENKNVYQCRHNCPTSSRASIHRINSCDQEVVMQSMCRCNSNPKFRCHICKQGYVREGLKVRKAKSNRRGSSHMISGGRQNVFKNIYLRSHNCDPGDSDLISCPASSLLDCSHVETKGSNNRQQSKRLQKNLPESHWCSCTFQPHLALSSSLRNGRPSG